MQPGLNSSTVGPFPPQCTFFMAKRPKSCRGFTQPQAFLASGSLRPQGPTSGRTLNCSPLRQQEPKGGKIAPVNSNSIFLNWKHLPSTAHPSDTSHHSCSAESQETLAKAGAARAGQGSTDRAQLLSIRKQLWLDLLAPSEKLSELCVCRRGRKIQSF